MKLTQLQTKLKALMPKPASMLFHLLRVQKYSSALAHNYFPYEYTCSNNNLINFGQVPRLRGGVKLSMAHYIGNTTIE